MMKMLRIKQIKEMFGNNEGIAGMTLIFLAIAVFGMIFMAVIFWTVMSSLETIGKGLMYFAVAFLIMIGTAILAKRFLFKSGVS